MSENGTPEDVKTCHLSMQGAPQTCIRDRCSMWQQMAGVQTTEHKPIIGCSLVWAALLQVESAANTNAMIRLQMQQARAVSVDPRLLRAQ